MSRLPRRDCLLKHFSQQASLTLALHDVLFAQVSLTPIYKLTDGASCISQNSICCHRLTTRFSYLPLLLLPLPLSLSPVHLILLLALTYVLNRPCFYCSFLLVILFASSCHWSNRCFIDFSLQKDDTASVASWFIPRLYTTTSVANTSGQASHTSDLGDFLVDVTASTVSGLAHVVKDSAVGLLDDACQKITSTASASASSAVNAGIGTHWLHYLIGRSEWTLPCVGVKIVL